jgi:hypothetical protein
MSGLIYHFFLPRNMKTKDDRLLDIERVRAYQAMCKAYLCPGANNPELIIYFDRVIRELLADGLTPVVATSVSVGTKSVYILPINGAQQVVTDKGQRKVFANRALNIVGFLDDMDNRH